MFDKGLLTLTDIKKTMRGLVGYKVLQDADRKSVV